VLNSYLKVLAQSAEGGKVGAEEAKGMLARMRELNVPVDVITMSTVMEILVAAVRYVYGYGDTGICFDAGIYRCRRLWRYWSRLSGMCMQYLLGCIRRG